MCSLRPQLHYFLHHLNWVHLSLLSCLTQPDNCTGQFEEIILIFIIPAILHAQRTVRLFPKRIHPLVNHLGNSSFRDNFDTVAHSFATISAGTILEISLYAKIPLDDASVIVRESFRTTTLDVNVWTE